MTNTENGPAIIHFSRMTKSELDQYVIDHKGAAHAALQEIRALYNNGWIYATKDEMQWFRWTN